MDSATYDAGISRAVASLLPSGFLNRKRIQGDLLSIIKEGFAGHSTVQQQIKQMTLEMFDAEKEFLPGYR